MCNSGRCRYEWDIDGNGQVSYVQEGQRKVRSTRSTTITRQQIQELVDAIWQVGAVPLQEPNGMDAATVRLTIRLSGRSNLSSRFYTFLDCGENGGHGGLTLCELEHKFEAILNPWDTPTPTP